MHTELFKNKLEKHCKHLFVINISWPLHGQSLKLFCMLMLNRELFYCQLISVTVLLSDVFRYAVEHR